jgi:ABC-type transport system involved in multi-copper enzyme maturation permease subunit
MNPIFPIAAITFKEGIRNRAIYGITIVALMMVAVNFIISEMIMREVGKVAMDIALSTVSFSGLLLVFFVGINLMAKDLDKKTIYMVLARPISRTHYICGKFLGIIGLIFTSTVVQSVFAAASLFMLQRIYPAYFLRFSWPMFALALLFIVMMLILLSALSFLFAALTSTSFVALVLTIISYLIGISLTDVKALVESPGGAGIDPSPLTVKVVQISYYVFPNLSFFDIKTRAAHALVIPFSHICWIMLYGLSYTAIVMTVTCIIFSKREFP